MGGTLVLGSRSLTAVDSVTRVLNALASFGGDVELRHHHETVLLE